jgi:acyl dehydratase
MSVPAKSFADVEIGDEIGPAAYVPTREMVERYTTAARVSDQRFLDPERARQTGFQRPIVPGPLTATFLAKLVIDHFPGWRLRTFQVNFRTPVAHGEALTCTGMVTEKNGREEDGTAAVHCDVMAENGQGDRAVVGTAILVKRG